jgi:1-acyl-sn-glycerol-3-phosphate acyltransferase
MIKRLAKWLFLDVWGWRVVGPIPTLSKYLIVVAPHTSNWDFLLGVLFRAYNDGFQPKYIAKKELFIWPFGYFFRALGGYPVERKKNTNFVDSVVEVYQKNEKFATTITPEGTRGFNSKWKTGFYYISQKAEVPIVRIAFDYATKRIVFSEPYHITKGVDDTIIEFKQYFSQYKGKNPADGPQWPE